MTGQDPLLPGCLFIECYIIGIPGPTLHFSFQLMLVMISLIHYNFNLSLTNLI